MASGPITSWEIDGDTVETVADFIFLGSKITVDGDCNHEIKRHRIQDAWGWCTGMTQRDGMGREVGGGSGWETHVHLWQIHVDVWQNQYNIVK